ncbi:MAG TPA: helix-turn-helix domain-containing protein [Acidothermaceae bacterium]
MDDLLTSKELAQYLGVPVATLYQWRAKSAGPRAAKVGRYLRYRRQDVESWIASRSDQDAR